MRELGPTALHCVGCAAHARRWRREDELSLAVALVALAVGLVVNTALGPVGLDVLDHPVSPTIENQVVGLELVSVLLVAPWCLMSAVLLWRGHRAGAPLAVGPAAYTAYMFVRYVLGPERDTYGAGVLLHLALFTLGLVVATWAWARAVGSGLRLPLRHRRAHAVALGLLAAFVLSRYAAGLVAVAGDWFALVPPSMASMAAVMLARDDPYAVQGQVLVLGAVAVLFATYAVVVFRLLFRR